jgi:hypothetical protein
MNDEKKKKGNWIGVVMIALPAAIILAALVLPLVVRYSLRNMFAARTLAGDAVQNMPEEDVSRCEGLLGVEIPRTATRLFMAHGGRDLQVHFRMTLPEDEIRPFAEAFAGVPLDDFTAGSMPDRFLRPLRIHTDDREEYDREWDARKGMKGKYYEEMSDTGAGSTYPYRIIFVNESTRQVFIDIMGI